MTHQQIPVPFEYGNILYKVSYTIVDNIADVVTQPVELPGTGIPYSFDISGKNFRYRDLTGESKNTRLMDALTDFLTQHVAL